MRAPLLKQNSSIGTVGVTKAEPQAETMAENTESDIVTNARKTCAKFILDWLSSGNRYIESDTVVTQGGFHYGTARNNLSQLCRRGSLFRYSRGLYALKSSNRDNSPRGVSGASDLSFARVRDVGDVKRVEVWDLLEPDDFAMHDVCFALRKAVHDSAPYVWCQNAGVLFFQYSKRNGFYVSNKAWNSTHSLGGDPLRQVKVNIWRDGYQIIFGCRNKPILPIEILDVIAHIGWVLREIHSTRLFDNLDHYQSHVGRDYVHAMEVGGPAYRMSVRDFFGRVLTYYVTSLKRSDGSKVQVGRYEAIDARRIPAKDWASFRTDPLTALMAAIDSLQGEVQLKLDVLQKGGTTIQQQLSALTNAIIIQTANVDQLVRTLTRDGHSPEAERSETKQAVPSLRQEESVG